MAGSASRWDRRQRTLIASLGTAVAIALLTTIVVTLGRDNRLAGSDAAARRTTGPAEGAIGGTFPDFAAPGADGKHLTRASLTGTPTLAWFTDSTCPDPDGLRQTARLDDDLGNRLQVIVVLIDQHESGPVLNTFRDCFGRPDWLVAPDPDGSLAAKIRLRTPETKYLLDKHGRILDINSQLVTAAYLDTVREKATV